MTSSPPRSAGCRRSSPRPPPSETPSWPSATASPPSCRTLPRSRTPPPARNDALQKQLADASARADGGGQQTAALAAQLAATRAELDRTVKADKATIDARLGDLARLTQDVQALTALRDQLEAEAKTAAAKTITDEQARAALQAQLGDEQKLSDSARAQIALMNQQLQQLRAQVATVSAALDVSEQASKAKGPANLQPRLPPQRRTRLQVEELQR